MIHLRIRRYGSDEWTKVQIDGDYEEELWSLLISRVAGLHIQQLNEEGEWETVDA